MTMADFLCDFCRREWTEDSPMVEGHHGSLVCGRCLTVAYIEVVSHERSNAPVVLSSRIGAGGRGCDE